MGIGTAGSVLVAVPDADAELGTLAVPVTFRVTSASFLDDAVAERPAEAPV